MIQDIKELKGKKVRFRISGYDKNLTMFVKDIVCIGGKTWLVSKVEENQHDYHYWCFDEFTFFTIGKPEEGG